MESVAALDTNEELLESMALEDAFPEAEEAGTLLQDLNRAIFNCEQRVMGILDGTASVAASGSLRGSALLPGSRGGLPNNYGTAHPLFDRSVSPLVPGPSGTRKANGNALTALVGNRGAAKHPGERGYTKEIIGTDLAERVFEGPVETTCTEEEGAGAVANEKQRINDKAR